MIQKVFSLNKKIQVIENTFILNITVGPNKKTR
jgi:hypothetical protein